MNRKTVGVLGGMGPDSTVIFFQKVVALTPAQRDQEHIPMLIFNNPLIPDRTAAILQKGDPPLEALKDSVALLERNGVDFISIPCNTAHFWYDEMQNSVGIPILNMIELVVAEARRLNSKIKKVGLLATKGTVQSRLYHHAFEEVEAEVLTPDAGEQEQLQRVIQNLKKKTRQSGDTEVFIQKLVERGAEAVVLGCTEFSLIAANLSPAVPIVDSTDVLARKTVELAAV